MVNFGDVLVTKVGVFKDTTVKAGVDGQNVVAQTENNKQATIHFISLPSGQVLVLKELRQPGDG